MVSRNDLSLADHVSTAPEVFEQVDNPEHPTVARFYDSLPANAQIVDMAHGVETVSKPVYSTGFGDCNLFMIKNMRTGNTLFMHNWFDRKQTEGQQGISAQMQPLIDRFFQEAGAKVGISVFAKLSEGGIGGADDCGLTDYFKKRGVTEFRRYQLPEPEAREFHVSYNPNDDQLKVMKEVDLNNERARGEIYTLQAFEWAQGKWQDLTERGDDTTRQK